MSLNLVKWNCLNDFSNTVKSVFSLLNCHLFFEAVYLILYSVMLGPLALFIVTMKMMRSLPGPARSVMVVDVGDASLKIQWIVWMMHATNEFCRGLRHRTNWLCASTQLLMIADAYEISFPKSFEPIFSVDRRHHSSSIIINLRFRSSFSSFSNAKPTLVSP